MLIWPDEHDVTNQKDRCLVLWNAQNRPVTILWERERDDLADLPPQTVRRYCCGSHMRINGCMPCTRNHTNLLQQRYHFGTAATFGVTPWLICGSPTDRLLQDLSGFCRQKAGEFNGESVLSTRLKNQYRCSVLSLFQLYLQGLERWPILYGPSHAQLTYCEPDITVNTQFLKCSSIDLPFPSTGFCGEVMAVPSGEGLGESLQSYLPSSCRVLLIFMRTSLSFSWWALGWQLDQIQKLRRDFDVSLGQ